jgi:hypothetical protein
VLDKDNIHIFSSLNRGGGGHFLDVDKDFVVDLGSKLLYSPMEQNKNCAKPKAVDQYNSDDGAGRR